MECGILAFLWTNKRRRWKGSNRSGRKFSVSMVYVSIQQVDIESMANGVATVQKRALWVGGRRMIERTASQIRYTAYKIVQNEHRYCIDSVKERSFFHLHT